MVPFAPDQLESAFRSAPSPELARKRLDLLLEHIDQIEIGVGRGGKSRLRGEAGALRRRVYEAAARNVQALDEALLTVLLQGSLDEDLTVPPILQREDLREEIRELAAPVYWKLLDRIEMAGTERRVFLWWVVESLARAVSIPSRVRERIYGCLHTLPREILPAFPADAPPITVIRRQRVEDFSPEQQRAIEGSAVVCALVADRELPPEYLTAITPRALQFSDPVTRFQIAEHPQADASTWQRFLEAPSPADRALPGRVDRAWADPEIRDALLDLSKDVSLPERTLSAVGLQLCRAAPLEIARAWVPEVLRHGGLSALALMAFDRPELAVHAREEDCECLLRHPEVRRLLYLADADSADPGAIRMARDTLTELRASPGGAFVKCLLGE